MNFSSEQGISLYFIILTMSIALAVALGLNSIVIKSLETTQEIEKTAPALYAADSGIEKAIYKREQENWAQGSSTASFSFNLSEIQASSTVHFYDADIGPCQPTDATMYCIYSTGYYKGTKRMLRIIR